MRSYLFLGGLVALLIAASAALASASEAEADSIVYVKSGNVWVASPDGSGQRKLTRDGRARSPYTSPSQSDGGLTVALRGTKLVKVKRNGKKAGKPIPTVLTGKPAHINAVGPFDVRISPDGTMVAYWVGVYSHWTGNGVTWTTQGPAVVWQSLRNGRVLGITHHYEEPSWVGNDRTLLFEETNVLTAQAVVAQIGEDHNSVDQWFNDWDTRLPGDDPKGIAAGELTRAGDRLAVLRAGATAGNGGLAKGQGNRIALYEVSGLGSPPAQWPCEIAGATGGEFGAPTWAPSGAGLAWAEGDGIWTTPVDGTCEGIKPKLTIPGATEPDWGPAAVGRAAKPKKSK